MEISQLLAILPQTEELFDWNVISSVISDEEWLCLLACQPQSEVHFDWTRVVGKKLWSWGVLLKNQPQFANYCDFSVLHGVVIRKILLHQIQFLDRCDLSRLTEQAKADIRKRYPEVLI